MAVIASQANRNRPWLTCSGWSGGPRASVPSALASSVVAAMKAVAQNMNTMATPGAEAVRLAWWGKADVLLACRSGCAISDRRTSQVLQACVGARMVELDAAAMGQGR